MKKQFAIFLMGIFLIQTSLFSNVSDLSLELNASYDYFRGLPDGTWNGNTGAFLMANAGACLFDRVGVQAGGSFGVYNWDGRGNLVFKNPKNVQLQSFVTAGLFSSFARFNGGLVYDRLFTQHFGIYDVNPSVDQLRFQGGYQFCQEEVGFWGTAYLTTSHRKALGVPISFRAINQINLFWTHYFENMAKTTVWIGIPYTSSLIHHHKRAGEFVAGFSLRVPLRNCLFIDGIGSYMKAMRSHGVKQSRNYAANICIGITYMFGDVCCGYSNTYMPVANHSNFLVDTNLN